MTGIGLEIWRPRFWSWNFEIKTLPEVSRPRSQPPGLETKTLVSSSLHRDQDLQVSSELKFKILGLEIASLALYSIRMANVSIHGHSKRNSNR